MTRTTEPIYKRKHDDAYSVLTATKGNNSLRNNIDKHNKSSDLEIMLSNKELMKLEPGRIFTPNISDADRIYSFFQQGLPKDKALEYHKEDIGYVLDIDPTSITCVENSEKRIVGITIAYPSVDVPSVAQTMGWHPNSGFNKNYFNKNAIYAELCAVEPAYQGSGLGNRLMDKLVLSASENGYNRVVGFAVPDKVNHHINSGFKSIEEVQLHFKDTDENISTYLISMDLDANKLNSSREKLNNYIYRN